MITAHIAPLATQTVTDINSVQGMINAINTLIAGVTNSTSQAAQNAALQQLDQLTSSNSFPSPTDMAQREPASIEHQFRLCRPSSAQTVQNWEGNNSGSTDAYGNPIPAPWDGTVSATTVGWCNYTDPSTLLAWERVWKK